jgi:predicted transcriptional regulator
MLNDYRYKITQEEIEKARELRATGLSQQKIADELGLTRNQVQYWTNDESRKKQREKNAKYNNWSDMTDEQKARKLAVDYKKRRENWKETPATYLKHSVHSAKSETRSNRHTVLGMDIADAEKAANANRPNKKVDY